MTKKILIIMDPIESINVKKDTTYQLMLSASKLKYKLYYLFPGTLAINSLEPVGDIAEIEVFENQNKFYKLSSVSSQKISDFDHILMREDPPVDNNYFYKTFILDLVKNNHMKVINSGSVLRNYNEKLITLNFPKLIPDTIVTCNKKDIENFKIKHKKIILKPLNLMGGRSIYLLEDMDKNFNVIFEDMTQMGKNYIMAQEFLSDVENGDKRIIIINGIVVEKSIIRKSSNEDHRSNIASGGSIEKYILTKEESEICNEIAEYLVSKNIFFAGVDMIGNKITEINITSPTCIAEINSMHNIDIGRFFWEQLK
tara:strand:+ start:1297 stop:2232 length:936 start_codon:yes stop_codon:yes gene_type:complete